MQPIRPATEEELQKRQALNRATIAWRADMEEYLTSKGPTVMHKPENLLERTDLADLHDVFDGPADDSLGTWCDHSRMVARALSRKDIADLARTVRAALDGLRFLPAKEQPFGAHDVLSGLELLTGNTEEILLEIEDEMRKLSAQEGESMATEQDAQRSRLVEGCATNTDGAPLI